MSYLEGFKIPSLEITTRNFPLLLVILNEEEKLIAQKKIEEMLKKEAITPVQNKLEQRQRSIFIRQGNIWDSNN